ncbi:Redox-sensitive bicupin YhaK [Commensalibacter communis]|nr:Redox-sensitive bicupin YhaK [Commensalibacter communis]CAI3944545.1 Redox-sensitive bicupin YhaK [Commensalibacter communis]
MKDNIMIEQRFANQRGFSDHGWLKARFTFSFANYWDPKQIGFSDLLVINDDQIASGRGFGTHPHKNMEIFSYVLEGALEHRDSMGNGSIIKAGDIQLMSAGSGVTHSEFNPSSTQKTHSLQIWIVPNVEKTKPTYQQHHISNELKRGKLQLIISPNGENNSLYIRQDIKIYSGLFDGEEQEIFNIPENRYVYLHVARGSLKINDLIFNAGDGARIRHEQQLHFNHGQNAEVLLFDMRPIETNCPYM